MSGKLCMENLEKQLRYLYFAVILTHLISLWLPSIWHSALRPGTHEGASSRSTLLQHAPGAKLPRLHQRFLATFAHEFCSLISNWFDMREQAPGANLLHESVSGASSLVCTEICFAGACFRSKLPLVYWNLLCGSVFQGQAPSCVLVGVLNREHVSGACFRSKLLRVYWLEYLPGSVFRERVSGASFFVCTGWSTYSGACFSSKLPGVYRPLAYHIVLSSFHYMQPPHHSSLGVNLIQGEQRTMR